MYYLDLLFLLLGEGSSSKGKGGDMRRKKGFAFRSLNSPVSFVVTLWSWGTANNLF
ncbi:hypothetical protein CCMA1212_004876 [Trichoderma ghanense]|uniref:Uncharacterized protein n=1 Tax=Trichoderma ghanense TaxID=65468 RepID=A0ABY2H7H5_9HYPO